MLLIQFLLLLCDFNHSHADCRFPSKNIFNTCCCFAISNFFLSGFRWLKLMSISLIRNAISNLIHFHGFYMDVLLQLCIKIAPLCQQNRAAYSYVKLRRFIIFTKGFYHILLLSMLIKELIVAFPRQLSLLNFNKLQMVLSRRVNQPSFPSLLFLMLFYWFMMQHRSLLNSF